MAIRPATEDDLPAIKAIYDHQVRHGIATFDLEPPPLEVWRRRLESTEAGDHVLVADVDGRVLGYAYSSSYRPRPAYRWTRETSVYLAEDATGRGLGRELYDVLLPLLRADGMRTAVALVALPNPASEALHRACGFRSVGVLHEVGHKLGRWIDTEWFELPLASAPSALT
jgi:L-amino acid N-acyltransferase YncA